MQDQWFHKIFSVSPSGFEDLALQMFRFQYEHNSLYRSFADTLGIGARDVVSLLNIPYMPIQFFRTHIVKTTEFEPEIVFESSGTSQTINSHHAVKSSTLYTESFMRAFEIFYGPPEGWCIIGLLPSYLERKNSSLVYMVDRLIRQTGHPQSGFYLHDYDRLFLTITENEAAGQKTLLLGVSFALIDFAEHYEMQLKHTVVMETGGMKGRRREMIRSELHDRLKNRFHTDAVHSEYGMTELLSQAYSNANGVFHCPPWMKVSIRDEEDPLEVRYAPTSAGKSSDSFVMDKTELFIPRSNKGAINIIDLANAYSCSFIATDDAGILHNDGSFEVLGRLDNSDIRGCSLMAV